LVDIVGSFALLLAFLAALYAFCAGIAGIITRRPLLIKSARNAGMSVFFLVAFAVATVEYFFLTNNFTLAYVAQHSNRALPIVYKIAALWSGQEGSCSGRFFSAATRSSPFLRTARNIPS
jgi:cytochrome c-type biogenesis protein CcmF